MQFSLKTIALLFHIYYQLYNHFKFLASLTKLSVPSAHRTLHFGHTMATRSCYKLPNHIKHFNPFKLCLARFLPLAHTSPYPSQMGKCWPREQQPGESCLPACCNIISAGFEKVLSNHPVSPHRINLLHLPPQCDLKSSQQSPSLRQAWSQ